MNALEQCVADYVNGNLTDAGRRGSALATTVGEIYSRLVMQAARVAAAEKRAARKARKGGRK